MKNSPRQLIQGGTVVDGLGSRPQLRDILIEGDRIAAVSADLDVPDDAEIVEAHGLHVTPGFIDLHSHADFTLLAFPTAESAVMQGITTVSTGNCGGGVAPIRDQGCLSEVAFAYDPDWNVSVDWSTFGEYAAHLDGAAVNVAPLVGHGPIRISVMGMEPRRANHDERTAMNDLLARCLDEGAFGLSTGLEYKPGTWSHEDEIRDLVDKVGNRSRLYATHMRGRAGEHAEATAEALRAVKDSGARLQLSHFASRPHAPPAVSQSAFDLVEKAVSEGQHVGVDSFPEIWGPALLIDLFPEWALEGSPSQVLTRLRSKERRSTLIHQFDSIPGFLAQVAGYGEIYVANAPGNRELTGLSLTDIASMWGVTEAEASCDLLLGAGEQYRSVAIRHIYATEEDLRRTMALPFCSIESDGIVTSGEGRRCPLIWNSSSYGYAARVLEHYVRNEGFFTIQEAVRRMTSLPASSLGLSDRGSIAPGNCADLVVLDDESIRDRSTPSDPARHPNGFEFVFVNGKRVVEYGRPTGIRNGQLLKP